LQTENTLYEQSFKASFSSSRPVRGHLYRRPALATSHSRGGALTIGLGFSFTAFLVFYAFPHITWLRP